MISWTHWTPKGTVRIEPVTLPGAMHYRLWFGETDLGVDLSLVTAAARLLKPANIVGLKRSKTLPPRVDRLLADPVPPGDNADRLAIRLSQHRHCRGSKPWAPARARSTFCGLLPFELLARKTPERNTR